MNLTLLLFESTTTGFGGLPVCADEDAWHVSDFTRPSQNLNKCTPHPIRYLLCSCPVVIHASHHAGWKVTGDQVKTNLGNDYCLQVHFSVWGIIIEWLAEQCEICKLVEADSCFMCRVELTFTLNVPVWIVVDRCAVY